MSALPMAAIPHLLRPLWLLALLALPLLWWLWRQRERMDTPWRRIVDPHLLPGLLQEAPTSAPRGAWLFVTAYALSVFALAGPAWKQQLAPLYAPVAPLVVAMDMSSHMLAADLSPSRLLHARLKVEQLVALRKGGQFGLVAYAGDAFTVAPLSDDANSMRDLLAALTPDIMPVDGQRTDLAIRRSADLLVQAGYPHGRILLLTDSADAAAQTAAREASGKGYNVDVLGVGTAMGAPLPSPDGTFAQDAGRAMQLARLDEKALRALAQAGGGNYAALSADASDMGALGVLDSHPDVIARRGDADALRWRDDGPFLLLVLLPLAALGFRRGWLAVALLAMLSMPVQRVEAADANWWNGLWQRADQRADHALRTGDAVKASVLAQTPEQRAAAAYRGGSFATAARGWMELGNADAHYNRGNALAQLKQYPQAIAAYQRALQLQPGMADAQANLDLVRKLQQQQEQQKKQQQQDQQDHRGHGQPQQNQQNQQQNQQQQGQQDQKQPEQQQQGRQQDQKQQQNQDKNQQARQEQDQRQQEKDQQQPNQQQAASDQKKQEQADAAERRAIDQALRKDKPADNNQQRTPAQANETTAQREHREAIEALLQRVPDDPGGLLRRKFALEYAHRQQEGGK